jgi:adenine/guanine phosphoribosyltransferase-like PRPP-binding protein
MQALIERIQNEAVHIGGGIIQVDGFILLIDDFLATGYTIEALVELIQQSGAALRGIGCVIEKVFEHGRERLVSLDVPIVTLAKIDLHQDAIRVF